MKNKNHRQAIVSAVILLLCLLACRPVFAIGWTELLILFVIIIVLLWPFLLRVYRAFSKIRKLEEIEDKKNQ